MSTTLAFKSGVPLFGCDLVQFGGAEVLTARRSEARRITLGTLRHGERVDGQTYQASADQKLPWSPTGGNLESL